MAEVTPASPPAWTGVGAVPPVLVTPVSRTISHRIGVFVAVVPSKVKSTPMILQGLGGVEAIWTATFKAAEAQATLPQLTGKKPAMSECQGQDPPTAPDDRERPSSYAIGAPEVVEANALVGDARRRGGRVIVDQRAVCVRQRRRAVRADRVRGAERVDVAGERRADRHERTTEGRPAGGIGHAARSPHASGVGAARRG